MPSYPKNYPFYNWVPKRRYHPIEIQKSGYQNITQPYIAVISDYRIFII